MPRKSDAKQKLIETAAALFQSQGFNGTGLTQILEESGAPKGSFYYHFPDGKDQLAEAAARHSSLEIEEMIDEAFGAARSFPKGMGNLARLIGEWFKDSDYSEGCPIASILLETTPQSDDLRLVCEELFQSWITAIRDHGERLGYRADAGASAELLFMSLEGAWLLARARQSTQPFDRVAKLFEAQKN